MLSGISISIVVVIILALAFDFINGFHDTANAIATSVSTRVLTPAIAITMAAVLNFVGALMSTNVATTISKGLVSGNVEQYVIIAALVSAIIWNLITWYLGLPSSSSHALIGALIGATIADSMGTGRVLWGGVGQKVLIPLVASPILGLIIAYIFMTFLYEVLRPLTHRVVNKWFSKLQIVSAMFMAYSHGSNDAQKSMGIITLALISGGYIEKTSTVPFWVVLACALAMAIGTSFGGWKIIKTIGVNMIKLEPIGGFAAETAAAIVIETASHFGMPVSTTHVISSSIMGVGAAKRFSSVRWNVARNIVYGWIITIPITAIIGGLVVFLLKLFIR